MQFTLLPQRGLISLSGDDRIPFLQGLVSNDVTRIAKTGIVYAALLSPQGKFLHDFFLIDAQDSILIDCEKARLPDLFKRLNAYRLRSKVKLEVLPDNMGVTAIWGHDGAAPNIPSLFPDPRLKQLGFRVVGDAATIHNACIQQSIIHADEQAYDHMRLEIGVPDGSRDLIVDKSTLLPFGFEQLHGVDFTKGCYVGQEVTARTKHIGQVRKFLHKVKTLSGTLPSSGTSITRGGEPAGILCSHAGNIGLALMTLDILKKPDENLYECGDAALAVELPEWAK